MDLQSGKLYWPTTVAAPPSYPKLEENISCDVLIIGAGSSGAQCANLLCEQGMSVVIVDKRKAGEGSTSTNTALIQYAGEKSFVSLSHSFGEEAAARHLKLCEQSINDIERVSSQLPINPEFIRRDSLYYASCKEDVSDLVSEHALLKKYGFKVDLWDARQISALYPFQKESALYYHDDAEMNPLKFVYGLLEKVKSLGGLIFENTEITGRRFEQDYALFYTKEHREIRARHVIIAAGYEDSDFKVEKNATLASSYAVITRPIADFSSWHKRTLIWETARPYVYMRTTPDNRIIIGGMDKDTAYAETRDSRILASKDKLIEAFSELFPDIQAVPEYYLGAFYGGTHDGMPIIGQYDAYPHCYMIMAYGDNGTVYNGVLAKIVSDKILTGSSPDLDLYLQTRPLAVT
ncbi:FAD-dependent oxidoreductase [Paenibacillus sp. FSL R7-0273]|uniref:NAD(P)/FAD-dependent oxidoreductase n=1 Tax=Paenibacillus sp. FSL R7-0273 TaxID=1536772 RepID=UPI0004F882CE|nr:FAD-dependent oxidoreductase [Paenibacillus sp. FSL R7-0273]AIQ47374.1 FAD-dependent oxidoreductase [Paenibacillus sp. FSL R7-0273]OMF96071.1 FAD-dependent oxidoreductase [Paenibacillus sp. FSL R7-0273]